VLHPDSDFEHAQGGGASVSVLDAVDEKSIRCQVVFREVNEHIAQLTRGWNSAGVSLFVCECADQECAEAIEITPAEYERVRANGGCFLIRAGHQHPELERVLEGNGRYLVVEKTGSAALIARNSDPRQHA
jgi:hypothetical protein